MSHTSYMQTLYLHGALLQDLKSTSFSDSSYHGKGTCIVLPRSAGIPEWIMHRINRSLISTELPQNWHQNNEGALLI